MLIEFYPETQYSGKIHLRERCYLEKRAGMLSSIL